MSTLTLPTLPTAPRRLPESQSPHVFSGPAIEWPLWSTTMRVVVADPSALSSAKRIVDDVLLGVEAAANRFDEDSEIRRLRPGRTTHLSPVLAGIMTAAIGAAVATDGAVDPTVGNALAALGYDRDLARVRQRATGLTVVPRPAPGWQRLEFDSATRQLTIPRDVAIDLGAIAKAWAADRCAAMIGELLHTPALVSLGGDIATTPASGVWNVLVQDQPDDPAALIALPAGTALATSSIRERSWKAAGRELHHIIDPRSGLPSTPVWQSASVAARSCVTANTWSTGALASGAAVISKLGAARVAARLLGTDREPVFVGNWPSAAELAHGIPPLPGPGTGAA